MKRAILFLLIITPWAIGKTKPPAQKKPAKATAKTAVESQELTGMKLTGELERVSFPLPDDIEQVINQDIVLMPAETTN